MAVRKMLSLQLLLLLVVVREEEEDKVVVGWWWWRRWQHPGKSRHDREDGGEQNRRMTRTQRE